MQSAVHHSDELPMAQRRHRQELQNAPQISHHLDEAASTSYEKTYIPFAPSPAISFMLLAAIRLLAACYSPISDCDETFNYWEPMHYLLYGFGFQTWEYSPEFSLRSYAYLYPYALLARAAATLHSLLTEYFNFQLIPSPKIFVFYAVRMCLAVICASAETALYTTVRHRLGTSIAMLFLIFLASSPGMFRSSVEFLPSSFSMVLLISAYTSWMNNRLFLAVLFVAIAALLGWIFSAILALPVAIDILLRHNGTTLFAKYALISGVMVLAYMTPIDSYYFGNIAIAPLNHVLYNVFPKSGAGSHIFGEESWTFYAKNLLLNCNLQALMWASFPCLILVGLLFRLPEYSGHALQDRIRLVAGSYLALVVFISQPHKEERFLAPCYPFIALVAAIGISDSCRVFRASLSAMSRAFSSRTSGLSRKKISVLLAIITAPILTLSVLVGVSRIAMQVKSFHAPLKIYKVLSIDELSNGIGPKNLPQQFLPRDAEINICIGSEWYRFPTSFFLPRTRFRARFVRSGFDGLLPKPFQETENGTRVIPSGMNEFNIADPQQFWMEDKACHYFVHLDLSHREGKPSGRESIPITGSGLHVVHREPFLDSEKSAAGYRALFVPGFGHKLVHAEYQLLRNKELLPFTDV